MRSLPLALGILSLAPLTARADVKIDVDPTGHEQITINVGPPGSSQAETENPPTAATAPHARSRPALLVSASMLRQDSHEAMIPILTARISYPLTTSVTASGSVGVGEYETYMKNTLVPIRLGLEGRAGAAGIELGVQHMIYHEAVCGSRGTNTGAYGVGRVYVPLGDSLSLVGELGGSYVMAASPSQCDASPAYFEYGGWIGAGLQWSR